MAVQSYIKQNSPYVASLSLDFDADITGGLYSVYASVIHEWGDILVAEARATRVSTGEYTFSLSAAEVRSFGKYKILWRYIKTAVTYTSAQYVNVYSPYVSDGEFFDIYPELETEFADKFNSVERRVRSVIDTICGQSFQYYSNQSLTYEGTKSSNLYLTTRCCNILEVTQKTDIDITANVELAVESKYYMRLIQQLIPIATAQQVFIQPKFEIGVFYTVRGNWGWEYVPPNITDAAMLLIFDYLNDDTAYAKHGISQAKMDTYSMSFTDAAMSGSGNLEVDVLLMDYTMYTMGMI